MKKPLRAAMLPNFFKTLETGIHFIIPVGILITVLVMNYSPMMVGFIAIPALYVTALIRKASRISFITLLKTLEDGAKNAVIVAVAYHPLLLNGPTGEVVQTVIFCTLSIIAFVVCMERFCLVPLSWVETILFCGSGILLIWAGDTFNVIGLVMFMLLVAYQIIRYKKQPPRKKTVPPGGVYESA